MPIEKLDHVNIRTTRLSEMIDWYENVLGLHNGQRPDFPFSGAWMYAGATAAVHLIEIESPEAIGAEAELKLEHFAFSATDADAFEQKLSDNGQTFRRSDIKAIGLAQYNVWDPDGNHIHVDFQIPD